MTVFPKRRILLVDDEPLVCETVAMLLQFQGHLVNDVRSGEEALALFQPGKFDLVITDFFMPHMTGGDLAVVIKTRAPSQPIVLLTAYAERFRSPAPKLSGIDFVMEKPIPMDELNDAVTKFAPIQATG
jgi:CheY-like chemotaxis protein